MIGTSPPRVKRSQSDQTASQASLICTSDNINDHDCSQLRGHGSLKCRIKLHGVYPKDWEATKLPLLRLVHASAMPLYFKQAPAALNKPLRDFHLQSAGTFPWTSLHTRMVGVNLTSPFNSRTYFSSSYPLVCSSFLVHGESSGSQGKDHRLHQKTCFAGNLLLSLIGLQCNRVLTPTGHKRCILCD